MLFLTALTLLAICRSVQLAPVPLTFNSTNVTTSFADFDNAIHIISCEKCNKSTNECKISGSFNADIFSTVSHDGSPVNGSADTVREIISSGIQNDPSQGTYIPHLKTLHLNTSLVVHHDKPYFVAFVPEATLMTGTICSSNQTNVLKLLSVRNGKFIGLFYICDDGSKPSNATCVLWKSADRTSVPLFSLSETDSAVSVPPAVSSTDSPAPSASVTASMQTSAMSFINHCTKPEWKGQLCDGDNLFRFISFDTATMLEFANSQKDIKDVAMEQGDAMATVQLMNGRVGRTYTLGYGDDGVYVLGKDKYDEKSFLVLDSAINEAKKRGVRLIIPIINAMNGDDFGYPGHFQKFVKMVTGDAGDPNKFFYDEKLKQSFKDVITWVLNRKNTFTGVQYKDEPAILSWQLSNEIDDCPPEWSIDIAKHIKSLAPKTLVMTGQKTWDRISDKEFQSEYIDIVGVHSYSDYKGGDWIKQSVEKAHSHNKAFIVDEFAFNPSMDDTKSFFQSLMDNGATGALCWSLRVHSRNGGFYTHTENEFMAYHAPGFPKRDGFNYQDERDLLAVMYDFAMKYAGVYRPKDSFPVPVAPQAIDGMSRNNIKWFGAAWAEKYKIMRKLDNESEYKLVATKSDDFVDGSQANYQDNDESGKKASYKIIPVGRSGLEGPALELKNLQ